jgi:hypothetical protein
VGAKGRSPERLRDGAYPGKALESMRPIAPDFALISRNSTRTSTLVQHRRRARKSDCGRFGGSVSSRFWVPGSRIQGALSQAVQNLRLVPVQEVNSWILNHSGSPRHGPTNFIACDGCPARVSSAPRARRQLHSPVVLPQLRMLPVCDLVVRGVLKSQRRSAEGAEALAEISAR